MTDTIENAQRLFKRHGGIMRTHEIQAEGVHPRTLYALRDAGGLDVLSRGLYRLASLSPLADPDLGTVAKRILNGVICLISAVAIHELTTQIPHVVHVVLPRTARY